MRLILFCEGDAETNDAWSGSARSLVEALREKGHHVETVDCDLSGFAKVAALMGTFRPHRKRWWVRYHLGRLPFALRSRRASSALMRAGEYDAILQIGATFELEAVDPSRLFLYCDSNIRVAQIGAETGYSDATWLSEREFSRVAEREKKIYAQAARIFSMSRFVGSTFTDFFDVESRRVRAIHAGTNRDTPAVGSSHTASEQRILFVGRQFERKGGDLLLNVFRKVRQTTPGARLVIVGPEMNPAPDEPGVDYLGFLDPDVPADRSRLEQAFLGAAVYCMPTRFEPLGIAFLEAMAFGLPCVGPNAWAVPEMILDGETGILVDGFQVEDWARAVEGLLSNPRRRAEMGQKGKARRDQYFTWSRVADDLIAEMSRSLGD